MLFLWVFFFCKDDDEPSRSSLPERSAPAPGYHSDEEEESDADENIIVDDAGKPISRQKKKSRFDGDENVQAAFDIFGIDFNFAEFEQYDDDGRGSDRSSDEEDEYDELSDEEEAYGRREARRKKKEKAKKTSRKTIRDIYDPSELAKAHLTEADSVIRETDIPERFQLRNIPVTATRDDPEDGSPDDPILINEAKWIYENAFSKKGTISQQDTADFLDDYRNRDSESYRWVLSLLNL